MLPPPLVRVGRIDSDHKAFGHGPYAKAGIPFHIRVQPTQIPIRGNPPDFDERHELYPINTNMPLDPTPLLERISVRNHA